MTRTLIRELVLPYESMRTLYEGGCEVRLYRNEITGELQVGKRIEVHGLESALAAREATMLTGIEHTNILKVQDVARVPGYTQPLTVIELIMPYMERGSLFDAMERGERFSVAEARATVMAALLGLAELHESVGVLHRDIKSPNVLLTGDAALAKVGDLGVAVPMDADGTCEAYPNAQLYSPPETFTTRRLGRSSDLYQMGLVLIELVNAPFAYDHPDNSIGAVARRLERGRRGPRPGDIRLLPHVPRRMRAVINRAIAVDPDSRYISSARMSEALAGVRLVDWRVVAAAPGHRRWEGACAGRPDRMFAVEMTERRNGTWVMSGLQFVSRWQRLSGLPDQITDHWASAAATRFFDTIVDIATRH
jgi:eukaryotic-like serine/threonine-protein kinase